ncbi:MAG: hypothetical protein BV459_07980 [Thermoplasmata archaeon M11B2D]|nr:MAG: hypothetical protein BV459_07980 [Thermoplasmata archaeon M11B2D]
MPKTPDHVPITAERIKELSTRPIAQIDPNFITSIQNKKCPTCGEEISQEEFRNDISKREYNISGMCQKCQDDVFGVD